MALYAVKRALLLFVTFFIIFVIAFCVIRLLPGSPLDDPNLTPAARDILIQRDMLNQPIPTQLFHYIQSAVRLDFGVSLYIAPGVPVFDVIKHRMPITAAINLAALILALPLGVLLGTAAALGRGALSGKAVVLCTVLLVSVPSFVAAALLQYIFAGRLGIAYIQYIPSGSFWVRTASLALPVIALALLPMATVTRLLRAELVDMQNADFMAFARAKGLSRFKAVFNHGLRSSSIPLIPVIVLMFTDVVAGSLVVERVFSIPGMGDILINSILTKDNSLTVAVIVFYTLIELFALFIADIGLAFIDPRIRLTGGIKI
jgi:ABC-type dipeptide/oligopeptide/nickel transport system permease component